MAQFYANIALVVSFAIVIAIGVIVIEQSPRQ